MSTTLSIEEARDQLSRLIELAREGHEVIIQEPGNGGARLVAIIPPRLSGPRRFGLHEGEVWMSDDFNSPLADSFWLGEEAK